MNRYEESKMTELDIRLEKMEKQVRDLKAADNEEIKAVEIEEIIFDREKCKIGVMKVNNLLKNGYHIFRQFQTESGLVIELGRWGCKQS